MWVWPERLALIQLVDHLGIGRHIHVRNRKTNVRDVVLVIFDSESRLGILFEGRVTELARLHIRKAWRLV